MAPTTAILTLSQAWAASQLLPLILESGLVCDVAQRNRPRTHVRLALGYCLAAVMPATLRTAAATSIFASRLQLNISLLPH